MFDQNNLLDMVKRECKGQATEEEQEWLQDPNNHMAWCQALTTALSDAEASMQFHHNKISLLSQEAKYGGYALDKYLEEKEKYDAWQRKAQRYRNGISQRLAQVKILVGQNDTISHTDEIVRLTRAIYEHKKAALEADAIPEVYDQILWSVIPSKK